MHAYFLDTPDIEFQTSFNVTSDTPSAIKRGTAHFMLRQPNLFRVDLSSNDKSTVFSSDGTTLTIFRPAEGKYARIPARNTTMGTMYLAVGLLNIQARLVDFLWTVDYGQNVKVAPSGTETVAGNACNHFSVDRFEDIWDVWLGQTDPPLPCKLVSGQTVGNDRTVQTNEFSWNQKPAFSRQTFVFEPPEGSREVGASDLH